VGLTIKKISHATDEELPVRQCTGSGVDHLSERKGGQEKISVRFLSLGEGNERFGGSPVLGCIRQVRFMGE